MKKTLTILFTFIYLITSSGVLLGEHLCMGKINETKLYQKVENKCGMSSDMHKDMDGCCDDDWSVKIIEDEQQLSNNLQAPKANFFVLYEVLIPNLTPQGESIQKKTVFSSEGPPIHLGPPLYLYFQNLKLPADQQS